MNCTKLIPLSFNIYEMFGSKKTDEKLCIDISDFDKSKISLVKSKDNPNNFDILYDGQKFCLFVNAMNGKIKESRCFEETYYLSIKDDCVCNKLKINEMFFCLKEKLKDNLTQEQKEKVNLLEWSKIWMSCCEYDLTEKRIYHFEKVYLAVDKIVLIPDEYFPMYRLECIMVGGSAVMCKNCDTFIL